jgi:diguanylate cyclase (GGDEF)-like protein/PAS domain S-box-containing protein
VWSTKCLPGAAGGGSVVTGLDRGTQANVERALQTLGRANKVLVHAPDEGSLLREMCATIVDTGGYSLAWVGYAEHDEARTVRIAAAAGETGYLEGLRVSWADDEFGRGPGGTVVRGGGAYVMEDSHADASFAPWRDRADAYGLRTSCTLPVSLGDVVVGQLAIYASSLGAFDRTALALLSNLAEGLSYGLGRLRDAASLKASEERFRALANWAPIGILEASPQGELLYANPKAVEISGRGLGSLLGKRWLEFVHPDDLDDVREAIGRSLAEPEPLTLGYRIRRPDGEVRHVRVSAVPTARDEPVVYVASVHDVTSEVQAHEALARQVYYDPLTGLPNRALFLGHLGKELARQRNGRANIAVLFLDLDELKLVNASLGHEAGDVVLHEVARRFSQAVRAGETVARVDGDEFGFLLRDVPGERDAVGAAKRILGTLRSSIAVSGHEVTVSGSIGIVLPGDNEGPETLVRDAETAMCHAKSMGRNRVAIFDDDLYSCTVARLALEGELRQALARHELTVYYQPKVRADSGVPFGAEALVRWQHPKRGLLGPAEFISLAEHSGLIVPIGRWVLGKAVAQLAEWDAGPHGPRLEVLSVNVSARQLEDPYIARTVRRALDRARVPAGRFAVEVTESAAMAESPSTRRALKMFKDLGLQVAIDDFGTGYSSLAYLHTLPVTTVKIDRSFVERLGNGAPCPVLRAIVDMSHALGLNVVAEGVSDEQLQAAVAELGCDISQGFYWARPMPPGEFSAWWHEHAKREPAERRNEVEGRP